MRLEYQIYLDPEDMTAFKKRIEAIGLKYGPSPAPHLVKAFEREMREAAAALGKCAQFCKDSP